MKHIDNMGLRFLIGILFSIVFLITRMNEGHFGKWSEVTFSLMLLGPTVILLTADWIKQNKRKP